MFLLILLVYNLVFPLAWMLALPGAIRRTRSRGGTWEGIYQRFGFYSYEVRESMKGFQGKRVVWVHAVSVGEAQVAVRLVRAILRADQLVCVSVTSSTPTGQEVVKDALGSEGRVVVLFAPYDFPLCVWSAFRLIKPRHLVLTESELWPNLLAGAWWKGIPVTLANARLSPRSAARYAKILWLTKSVLRRVGELLATELDDVERWRGVGVSDSRIVVTGNMKFDTDDHEAVKKSVEELKKVWEGVGGTARPMVLGASTHPGEELMLVAAVEKLRRKWSDLVLFLAPRHVERSEEIENELKKLGMSVARRTRAADRLPDSGAYVLLDVTGELMAWQFLADVVVVGKSFLREGGQNPAEGVMAGKPVVFGPNMQNFAALTAGLLAAEAAIQTDESGLTEVLASLLESPERGKQMAARGAAFLDAHRGAVQRAAARVLAKVC